MEFKRLKDIVLNNRKYEDYCYMMKRFNSANLNMVALLEYNKDKIILCQRRDYDDEYKAVGFNPE